MSPKSGRPKAEKPKCIRYSVRLDEETENKLKGYSERNKITRVDAIRKGIDMLLESETKEKK